MTDEELREIKARAEAATPGPWITHEPLKAKIIAVKREKAFDYICSLQVSNCPNFRNDAEFIAHAREDVPNLIAEVERLRKSVDDAMATVRHITAMYEDANVEIKRLKKEAL
jgi:hypothetical protein